jgi:putative transposase
MKNTNIKNKNKNDSVIDIDVGLSNWITLSDSQVVDRPKFLAKSLKKIKTLQRKLLSKKKKGSHNKLKAKRIQLATLCRKVGLQREDYCHKVTTDLTKLYRTLIFEKLSISNMVKNHNLATSILDATWYKIKQLAAAYKAEVYQIIAKDTPDLL